MHIQSYPTPPTPNTKEYPFDIPMELKTVIQKYFPLHKLWASETLAHELVIEKN